MQKFICSNQTQSIRLNRLLASSVFCALIKLYMVYSKYLIFGIKLSTDSRSLSITGFIRLNADQNSYIQNDGIMLLLYVDDMLVAYADSSSERAIDVKNTLMKQYQISNLNLATLFLGLNFTRPMDGSIVAASRVTDSVIKHSLVWKMQIQPPHHYSTRFALTSICQPIEK